MSLKTWLNYMFSTEQYILISADVEYTIRTESGYKIIKILEEIKINKDKLYEDRSNWHASIILKEKLSKMNRVKFNKRAEKLLKLEQKKGFGNTRISAYMKGKHLVECTHEISCLMAEASYDTWIKLKGLKK